MCICDQFQQFVSACKHCANITSKRRYNLKSHSSCQYVKKGPNIEKSGPNLVHSDNPGLTVMNPKQLLLRTHTGRLLNEYMTQRSLSEQNVVTVTILTTTGNEFGLRPRLVTERRTASSPPSCEQFAQHRTRISRLAGICRILHIWTVFEANCNEKMFFRMNIIVWHMFDLFNGVCRKKRCLTLL